MAEDSPSTNSEETEKRNSSEPRIPAEIKTIIKELPPDKQAAVKAFMVSFSSRFFKGPLPHPDILEKYNKIIPNGAERILSMAERQSEHRITMENTNLNRQLNQSGKGQNFAFVIAMAFLLISGFLIYEGHDIAGTTLGTVDILALVTVFITGKSSQKKENNPRESE